MTRETLRESDPALAAALDSIEAPPLPPSFADRVAAAAQARPDAALPRARRGMRRGLALWTHGRRAVLGSATLLVAGATAAAAATGLFERVGVDLAPVERMVERVAQAVPGLATAEEARPAPQTAPQAAEARSEPSPKAEPLDDPRRERLAQAIAARIERRIARAEARGITVPERLRTPESRMDPARAAARPERAELVERVQQIRRERQSAESVASLAEPDGEDAIARMAEGWSGLSWQDRIALVRTLDRPQRRRLFAALTPEQRAEILQMRRRIGPIASDSDGI